MEDKVLNFLDTQYTTPGFNFLYQKAILMLALMGFLVQRSMGVSPRKRFIGQKCFVDLHAMITSQ